MRHVVYAGIKYTRCVHSIVFIVLWSINVGVDLRVLYEVIYYDEHTVVYAKISTCADTIFSMRYDDGVYTIEL